MTLPLLRRHGLAATAALALLALLLAAVWPIGGGGAMPVAADMAAATAPAPPSPTRTEFTLSTAAETAAARPLFRADRKPYQANTATPAPTRQDLPRLMGTIQRGDTARALFEGGDGAVFSAGLGEDVAGWQLERIAAAEVELTRDGRRQLLRLEPNQEPPDTSAPPPSRPAPAPARDWQSDDPSDFD
ncbi:MAG: hypothetical protein Tsb0016_10260 [Sphingomonadales bacterium]